MKDFKKNRDFGHSKPYGRPMEMHKATCASCGKICEVPFKPNGTKPVYCKDCFGANGGRDTAPRGGNDRFPRKDFSRPAFRPDSRPASDNNGMNDVKKQLESLNYKMDKLITILSENATKKVETPKKVVKKIVSKKK